ASGQCGGVGDARCAAVAAGEFNDVPAAQEKMACSIERTLLPDPQRVEQYQRLYTRYQQWCATTEPLFAAKPAH
ncbi:ribulokinase, partial [Rahnella perminowiae]|nr:ribulokinase [Rahnella perminowiae]